MFQYTNTIVINSDKDSSGLNKWTSVTPVGADPGPEVIGDFNVRRVMHFTPSIVKSISKRAASDAVIGKVDFAMANSGAGVYRIALYMRLSGSQNSYYANDFVFKGKPFFYEFKVAAGDTATQMATAAKTMIDKLQALYGDKYIKATTNAGTLTISGVDEYQLFTQATIQKFDATLDTALVGGEFVDVINGTITKGKEGFGTYTHILKDLRLPTIENRKYMPINEEEIPVPGVKYNQYTVTVVKDRGVMNGAVVGGLATSQTTHVFYVASAVAADFETALGCVGTVTAITK